MAYSYVQYTANGSTQTFSVTFPYINADHVEAYVDDVEDTTFTWPTSATITLSAMPSNGAIVKIKRVTPKDERLVDFEPGNTVSEDNLDTDSDQNFFAMQETLEEHADKMGLDIADNEWDAESHQIKNVTDPTEAQHAVTKNYIDSTFTAQLNTAVTAAQAAKTAAELAETNAETAKTAAELAETNAETAEVAAELAETNAETAEVAAELAETNAAASESMAEEWAEKAEDSAITGNPGQYSALHHATKAAAWITGFLGTANEYTKQQNFNKTTLTSGTSIAWNLEDNQVTMVTLAHNATLSAPTNIADGATYILIVLQDGTGNRTLSWNTTYHFEGDAPVIQNEAGTYTIFMFVGVGSVLKGSPFFIEE